MNIGVVYGKHNGNSAQLVTLRLTAAWSCEFLAVFLLDLTLDETEGNIIDILS